MAPGGGLALYPLPFPRAEARGYQETPFQGLRRHSQPRRGDLKEAWDEVPGKGIGVALYPLPGPPLSPQDAEGGKGRVFVERDACAFRGARIPLFLYIGNGPLFSFFGV
jgi:hypothetical protein